MHRELFTTTRQTERGGAGKRRQTQRLGNNGDEGAAESNTRAELARLIQGRCAGRQKHKGHTEQDQKTTTHKTQVQNHTKHWIMTNPVTVIESSNPWLWIGWFDQWTCGKTNQTEKLQRELLHLLLYYNNLLYYYNKPLHLFVFFLFQMLFQILFLLQHVWLLYTHTALTNRLFLLHKEQYNNRYCKTLLDNKSSQQNNWNISTSSLWTVQALSDEESHPHHWGSLPSPPPLLHAAAIRQTLQNPTGLEKHLQKILHPICNNCP